MKSRHCSPTWYLNYHFCSFNFTTLLGRWFPLSCAYSEHIISVYCQATITFIIKCLLVIWKWHIKCNSCLWFHFVYQFDCFVFRHSFALIRWPGPNRLQPLGNSIGSGRLDCGLSLKTDVVLVAFAMYFLVYLLTACMKKFFCYHTIWKEYLLWPRDWNRKIVRIMRHGHEPNESVNLKKMTRGAHTECAAKMVVRIDVQLSLSRWLDNIYMLNSFFPLVFSNFRDRMRMYGLHSQGCRCTSVSRAQNFLSIFICINCWIYVYLSIHAWRAYSYSSGKVNIGTLGSADLINSSVSRTLQPRMWYDNCRYPSLVDSCVGWFCGGFTAPIALCEASLIAHKHFRCSP